MIGISSKEDAQADLGSSCVVRPFRALWIQIQNIRPSRAETIDSGRWQYKAASQISAFVLDRPEWAPEYW